MKLNLLFISAVLGQGQIFQEIGNGNVAKVKGKKNFRSLIFLIDH